MLSSDNETPLTPETKHIWISIKGNGVFSRNPPKGENRAYDESARFTWHACLSEDLARIQPNTTTPKPQELNIEQNSEEGGERTENPNSNYLRSKTQISENMIALFPRCTRSSSYRGQLIENSNTDRVLTSHTVDLNNSRSRQLT